MQKMYVSYVVEMPDGISERGVERVVDKVQMELHSAVGLPFKLVSVFGPIPAMADDKTRDPQVLDTVCEMPLYTMRLAQLDIHPFNNSRAAMEIAASDVMVMGLLKSLEEAGKTFFSNSILINEIDKKD
jgi:hypothetical protein